MKKFKKIMDWLAFISRCMDCFFEILPEFIFSILFLNLLVGMPLLLFDIFSEAVIKSILFILNLFICVGFLLFAYELAKC